MLNERFRGACHINNVDYRIGFMVRVKQDKIIYSKKNEGFWIIEGTDDGDWSYWIFIKEWN